MVNDLIFHICRQDEWREFEKTTKYHGSSQDKKDGFIHFSTSKQIEGSAAKHRAGQDNLIIFSVRVLDLGHNLKWETSRNGSLFPHFYGHLEFKNVVKVSELKLGPDGVHLFPHEFL